MKQVVPVLLLFTFSSFGTSLAAEKPHAEEQSVSDLIGQLRDKNPETVCAAAKTLGKLKPTKDAVTALKDVLKSRNSRVKWSVVEALWRLEHNATDLLPVYAELLTAFDPDVRAASAWRVGRWGSDARPVVLLLAAALRDENFEVRVQAGQALANLGPWAEAALPALVRALGDKQLDEPGKAGVESRGVSSSPALPALVELADEAIPLLIDTFGKSAPKRDGDDPDPQADWKTMERLAQARWETRERLVLAFPAFRGRAVAPLLQALESKDGGTSFCAALALREMARLNGLPPVAIEKLEQCLDRPDTGFRRSDAWALSWVPSSNPKIVRVLVKSRDGREIDNKELLAALERLTPHNEEARKLLFRMLGDGDSETVLEAHRILARLHLPADQVLEVWIKALAHADPNVRYVAVGDLYRLGPDAKLAKAPLHERVKKEEDGRARSGILSALTAVDPDDPALVALLIESLENRESPVRDEAIRCLAALGPKAKEALPRIETCLLKPRAEAKAKVRDEFEAYAMSDLVRAVARIAPDSTKTAATLLKALRRRDIRSLHPTRSEWHMRDVLEEGLQASLPAASALLREALKDQDAEVRQSVALVLLRAGLDVETALPVLMEEKLWSRDTFNNTAGFRFRVVEVLSRRQMSVSPAVAGAWCKVWQTADSYTREPLGRGLVVLQPEALPHLLEQLRQAKTTQARRDLAHLLARFEGQGPQVMPILREELREGKPADQYAAALALSILGPGAAEAVPELVRLLSHAHPGMRALAATTLASIGLAARPAVPALKAMLKEDKLAMCSVAADALSRIDPDASELLPLLREVLVRQMSAPSSDTDAIKFPEELRESGVYPSSVERSIARFGERGASVLAEVLDNVDLDEWSTDNVSTQCGSEMRIRVARLLARLGPEAKPAVPALIRALKDKDPFIRDAAASALGRIGPDAKQAAPDFISLLEEQNRLVSAGGTWSSSPGAPSRSVAAGRSDYGGRFDFRSAGRGRLLNRSFASYSDDKWDPYSQIRPEYPYDSAYVLSRIDSEARSAQPILREMARDASHPGRLSAALALWRCGCDSPDLIPAFTAELKTNAGKTKHKFVPLSRELRECLTELDAQLKPAVRVMVEWLKQAQFSGEQDQVAVVEALGRLGAEARSAVDVIRPMLSADRRSDRRRVAAALALFRIEGNNDLVFPALREVLLAGQYELHQELYENLLFPKLGMGLWALEQDSLISQSFDPTDTARASAARALGVLAEKGDERAKVLLSETGKGDENSFVRMAALEAMARHKPTNAAAMSGLCAMLRHPNSTVRIEAASACGRLGSRAKLGLKALQDATKDSQPDVRQAARRALDCLE